METSQSIFETKAYYNKWLKELTESEYHLVIEMLEEARIDGFESGYKQGLNFKNNNHE